MSAQYGLFPIALIIVLLATLLIIGGIIEREVFFAVFWVCAGTVIVTDAAAHWHYRRAERATPELQRHRWEFKPGRLGVSCSRCKARLNYPRPIPESPECRKA